MTVDKTRRLLRFSLRSLILLVALAGSGYGLWARWEPWGLVESQMVSGNAVHTICLSADGRRVAFRVAGKGIGPPVVLDLQTGKKVQLKINQALSNLFWGMGTRFVISPDGTRLAASAYSVQRPKPNGFVIGMKLLLWDIQTGRLLLSINQDEVGGTPMAFSLDGQSIGGGGSIIVVWNAETLERTHGFGTDAPSKFIAKHGKELADFFYNQVAFTPDGNSLAASFEVTLPIGGLNPPSPWPAAIHIWDLRTSTRRELPQLAAPFIGDPAIIALAFTPDGSTLVASSSGGRTLFWNVVASGPIRFREGGADALAFTLDNRTAASAWQGRIHLWDLASGNDRSVIDVLGVKITSLAFADDGQQLLVASTDGWVHTYACRRPEYWWGVAWLPEFWLTVVLGVGLLFSLWRDSRIMRA